MDERGVYEDPGTRGDQPNTESSSPEGTGVGSGHATGANKPDPVSTGPQLGKTIAGRPPETITHAPLGNVPAGTTLSPQDSIQETRSDSQTGGPETGGMGVTGHHGSSESAAHATPDTDAGTDKE